MELLLGLIFVTVFLLSYVVLERFKNLPPGPISFPVLGSIFFVQKFRKQRMHLVFAEAAKHYGNTFKFSMGPQQVVVLSSYDLTREALVRQAEVFVGRPAQSRFFKQAFLEDKGNPRGIPFNNSIHSWRTMRRFTLQVLRDFGVGKTSIEDKILTEVSVVAQRFEKLGGNPVSINSYLQNIEANVILAIVFGKRFDYGDPEFRNISSTIRKALSRHVVSPSNYLPLWLCKLINKEEAEQFTAQVGGFRQMREYVLQQIDDHEATFDKNHLRDFVDLYIHTVQEGTEKFDKDDIFRVIMDLFLAGMETVSSTLDWAFLYMAEYPDVQTRCQKEITQVCGDRVIQYSDRGQLVYVEATLLEIQRIAATVPNNVPHCAMRDTVLGGYNIPKNTVVFAGIYTAHQDPKYFDDPETFRPERFIDDNGKLLKNEALIPFSTGPRQCLGEPLAKMELFLVFANLLQRFTFDPEDKTVKHSFKTQMVMVTNVPEPYNMRINKRASTIIHCWTRLEEPLKTVWPQLRHHPSKVSS